MSESSSYKPIRRQWWKKPEMMGKIVVCRAVYQRYKTSADSYQKPGEARWVEKPLGIFRAGWFVGYRHLADGERIWDSDGGYYFRHKGTVPAIAVIFWPSMKPQYVPVDQVDASVDRYCGGKMKPYPPGRTPAENAKEKQWWKEHGHTVKRNKLGRFS